MYTTQLSRSKAKPHSLSAKELERRIGSTTYMVWQGIYDARNVWTGTTLISRDELATELGISPHTVKDCLSRLHKLQLVRTVGRMQGGRVWRHIVGSIWHGQLCLPVKVYDALMLNKGRGGFRANAGRPRKDGNPPMRRSSSLPPQDSSALIIKTPPCFKILNIKDLKISVSLSEERERQAGACVDSKTLVGRDIAQRLPGVPKFISVSTLSNVYTPDPPRLDPKAHPHVHTRLIVKWIEGCYKAYLGKRCWMFISEKKPLEQSKRFPLLLDAAKAFIENDISPALWFAWSFNFWNQNKTKKAMPPLAWLLSPKRMAERSGWFHSEAAFTMGCRMQYNDTERKFMLLQHRMITELSLLTVEECTDYKVQSIVHKYFPKGLYDNIVQEIKSDAIMRQMELSDAVARGEWLWGAL